MDLYPDVYGKLALVLTSTQLAKQDVVSDLGIGEDLPFSFVGWRDGEMMVMMALDQQLMAKPPVERIPACTAICQALRQLFHADQITFAAEGFISKSALKGRDLRRAFANSEGDVSECVTVCNIHINRHGKPDATIISAPYAYLLGKTVVWGDATLYEHGVGKVLQDSPIIAIAALELVKDIEYVEEEAAVAVLDKLEELGIGIQPFAQPPFFE